MAAVNNQPVRLRDLRDSTLPRDKSEVRAPTRRKKFEDTLKHEKAGEVVGEFPQRFDKGLTKQTLRRSALQVAKERQQPRQSAAALMAKEGISTATKFGSMLKKKPDEAAAEEKVEEAKKPAWMMLAGDKNAEGDKQELGFSERIQRLRDQQKEMAALNKFSNDIDGYSSLDKHLRTNDKRVLMEAGRLERSSFATVKAGNKEAMNLELMKKEMQMNQALNMQYLALQDKLQRGLQTLLSNILKARNEVTKNSISLNG